MHYYSIYLVIYLSNWHEIFCVCYCSFPTRDLWWCILLLSLSLSFSVCPSVWWMTSFLVNSQFPFHNISIKSVFLLSIHHPIPFYQFKSFYLSIYRFINTHLPTFHLPIYYSIYLSMFISIYISIHYLSTQHIHLFIALLMYLLIYLYLLSIYQYLYPHILLIDPWCAKVTVTSWQPPWWMWPTPFCNWWPPFCNFLHI